MNDPKFPETPDTPPNPPPSNPPQSSQMGRSPRRASALRGSIANIASANKQRHDLGDKERVEVKVSIELVQRIFQLVQRLSKFAHIHNPQQLNFVRQGMPGELSITRVRDLLGGHHERRCPSCSYSLRGLAGSGRCPECGVQYNSGLGSWDFTIADLYTYATSHEQTHCRECKYPLRGLARIGSCPECGARYKTGAINWEEMCQFICGELQLAPDQIQANTYVIERLTQCSRNAISGPPEVNGAPAPASAPPPLPNQPSASPPASPLGSSSTSTPPPLPPV